jgi:hypothetical protein
MEITYGIITSLLVIIIVISLSQLMVIEQHGGVLHDETDKQSIHSYISGSLETHPQNVTQLMTNY